MAKKTKKSDSSPYKKKYQEKINKFERSLQIAIVDIAENANTRDFDIEDIFEFAHPYMKAILYNTLIHFSPEVLKELPAEYEELVK